MKKKQMGYLLIFLILVVFLFSLFYGKVKIQILEVLKILLNKFGITSFEIEKKSLIHIVYNVRFPRVLCAIIVGGGLAICGCTMQSLLKNPIADAGIMGISGGASLGAVLAIATGLTSKYIFIMPIFAVIFACLIAGIVYKIAGLRGKSDNLLLILSGIAVSSFVGAITSAVLSGMLESQIREYLFWTIGSLNGRRWEHFYLAFIPILVLSFILMFYGKELNILLLGDEEAKSLGINVRKIKRKILIIASIITATSVCISGGIAFVGLIVPHILRRVIGSDNRYLLKFSFLGGAFFLSFSDLISNLFSHNLGVGIVTSLIGAPYFIWLIIKIKKGEKV